MVNSGLSPLARGTPSPAHPQFLPERFIPARAGNTRILYHVPCFKAVYPRSRGEHAGNNNSGGKHRGLSPLARGTRVHSWGIFSARSVYPRSRGEHLSKITPKVKGGGLSPLARGTRRFDAQVGEVFRFIPARAGNTANHCRLNHVKPVYPRSRGEHIDAKNVVEITGGLSPLARGTHLLKSAYNFRGRFIPARAGNTLLLLLGVTQCAVYPRSRGEHTRNGLYYPFINGLSPLARGTLRERECRQLTGRFIPARAGNTLTAAATARE